jgi:Fructose-1,6-bisphosphate aldolase
MANFPGEKITEGLDGLRERLTEYRKLGARFAKWRAVITIGDGIPTRTVHRLERGGVGALRGALSGM